MHDAASTSERHSANLAELAEMGMVLARDLRGRALGATDDKVAADLALAFHRVSRSVRQSMALEAKLERERKLADREEAQRQFQQTLSRVQRKRAHVRDALAPLIWTEAEGDEDAAEALFDELSAILMDEELITEAFVEEPLDAVVERIRADLGLPAPAADAGDTDIAAPGDAARQSSA